MKKTPFKLALFIVGLICYLSLTISAQATEAKSVLSATISSVLKELQNPDLRDANKREPVLHNVGNIISQLFDFKELSARTVGAPWKTFTPDQQDRFIASFTTLLRESYLEKFEGYDGEKVEYGTEVASSDGKRVEIQTNILLPDKKVPVAYRMMKKAQWVVYDINIEGVGMVQNYRKQFQEILIKGDPELLIDAVKKKALEAQNHNKQKQLE